MPLLLLPNHKRFVMLRVVPTPHRATPNQSNIVDIDPTSTQARPCT